MEFDSKELKERKYTEAYSEPKLFDKIKKFAKKAGIKVIYLALLLFYTLQQPETPRKAKSVIIGALGYFIFPMDLIPDFIPIAGFSDDLTALAGALVMVAMHVNEDTKRKAKERLRIWFGDYDQSELDTIDEKMNKDEIIEE
ncbi:DUF1232 domain-containing protein [Proteiniclasticum sp. SCR006]|uniref:DUF1232 domain-containing protein n=1 Tax=Proteiniclasticum aestuarii TaxID=2817862 RepID=A0A939KHF5_9CLOT|nr:YkvA family protein [Proteiniclasticum aestuarii]MBO1265424.1 DUF1232 domain-containing protein [Proteiniclasticum aestuarii]